MATTGALGLAGFLVAFAGTTLLAGDWWFEAFVGPVIAQAAPQILDLPPGGWLLAGGISTFVLFAIGWCCSGSPPYEAGSSLELQRYRSFSAAPSACWQAHRPTRSLWPSRSAGWTTGSSA